MNVAVWGKNGWAPPLTHHRIFQCATFWTPPIMCTSSVVLLSFSRSPSPVIHIYKHWRSATTIGISLLYSICPAIHLPFDGDAATYKRTLFLSRWVLGLNFKNIIRPVHNWPMRCFRNTWNKRLIRVQEQNFLILLLFCWNKAIRLVNFFHFFYFLRHFLCFIYTLKLLQKLKKNNIRQTKQHIITQSQACGTHYLSSSTIVALHFIKMSPRLAKIHLYL